MTWKLLLSGGRGGGGRGKNLVGGGKSSSGNFSRWRGDEQIFGRWWGLSPISPVGKNSIHVIYRENLVYIYRALCVSVYVCIYIYIYIYIFIYMYMHIYYISIHICNVYIYIYYSLRSWNNTTCAICWDKFLAFLHQQKFTKLYWNFNCTIWSVKYAWILFKKNKITKLLNKINSRS